MIRILIADDHHLVRQGLRALLERAHDIQVVGEAQDGQEAVELARTLCPDVVLMDLIMPRLNGDQAAEAIAKQGCSPFPFVLLLTLYEDSALIQRALQHGARGYLSKNCLFEELADAVRQVARGETYRPQSESHLAGIKVESTAASPLDQLSPRELEILKKVAEGLSTSAIGAELHLSVKTVEKYRGSLMSKVGVHNANGLILFAMKHRLIEC